MGRRDDASMEIWKIEENNQRMNGIDGNFGKVYFNAYFQNYLLIEKYLNLIIITKIKIKIRSTYSFYTYFTESWIPFE